MHQKLIAIGRVGKEPEIKNFDGGSAKASFSIACSEKYKTKSGEAKEDCEWFNAICWGKLAEIVEKYVHKGDLVYVEGKLKTRSYDKDGEKKYVTELTVDTLKMLGSKGSGSDHSNSPEHESPGDQEDDGDPLPF